jgi:hypothetical protein
MNYYKISKSPENTSTPDSVIHNNTQRYFILRNGDSAYYMNSVSYYKDSLTCTLETLPPEHRLHLSNGRNGNMRFKKYKPEAVVLTEVHVYKKQADNVQAGEDYTLMYNGIQKIEVLEKNKTRTTISYVLGGIAIVSPIALLVVAAAGAAAVSTFCWGC